MSIIKKEIENPCYECDGKGEIPYNIFRCTKITKLGRNCTMMECPTCNGTGIWKDNICYYIDDNKRIAFDGESGQ
jgi:DnaJ-class molecular chaperone